MRSNRVVTIAFAVGVLIVAVTFLGAVRMSGDDGKKEIPKTISPVKAGSRGVVTFANIDVDNGGLLYIFPETFPQPSKVIKVLVREGDDVSPKQPLAEFDIEMIDLTIAKAKGGLAQAEGALTRAKAAKLRAEGVKLEADAGVYQANDALKAHQGLILVTEKTLQSKASELESAKTKLEDAARKAKLVNALNDPDLKSAQSSYDAAQHALDAERAKLELLKGLPPKAQKDKADALLAQAKSAMIEADGAIAEAQGAVDKQKAELEQAEYGKKLMTLKAPVAGKIIRSFTSEGLTFGAQSRQPAFVLQPKGTLICRAEVDQEFASRIVKGQEAVIQDDGNASLKWTGKVLRISDGFLPKRSNSQVPEGMMLNETRVLECIVSIEGVDPNVPIRVGQRVKVSIGVE